MLATYQVLVEEELGCEGLGSGFPYRRYGARVRQVVAMAPRCVVPSSCGYRYTSQPWMNQRGFPIIGEEEFLADVRAIAPAIAGRMLAPGDGLAVDGLVVHRAALPMVEPRPSAAGATAWRPDRGVPPLIDEDPFDAAVEGQIERTGSVADEPIAQALYPTANRRNVDWQLARLGVAAPVGVGAIRTLPRRR